jgi:hypothetical protein
MIIESFYPQIFELFGLSKNGAFSSKCPRQTDNQTTKQTDRQTDRQTDKNEGRKRERKMKE